VLLALSVPYAVMMSATGIFFGLWSAPDALLTIVWVLVVTAPIWLGLVLAVSRGNPRRWVGAAIFSWVTAALLLSYIYR
jgi:hypothetical protein